MNEAESIYAQAVAGFEKLVASAPRAIDFQSHFGIVLSQQGKCLALMGKLSEGKVSLETRSSTSDRLLNSPGAARILIANCSALIKWIWPI